MSLLHHFSMYGYTVHVKGAESDVRAAPEIAPSSSGFSHSAGEVATTTDAALRAETPSIGPRYAVPPGTGNIRKPPPGATPPCPFNAIQATSLPHIGSCRFLDSEIPAGLRRSETLST